MQLSALVNGKEVIATFCPDVEWKEISFARRKGNVTVKCCFCGAPMYLRKRKGTKHFAHMPGQRSEDCAYVKESLEHLMAKSIIALACREAGWDVRTEAAGKGYVADVLATDDARKCAFEVQWSPQNFDDTVERTYNYFSDIASVVWLFKEPPEIPWGYAFMEGIIFHMTQDEEGQFMVHLKKGIIPLVDFVKATLPKPFRVPRYPPIST